MKHFFFILGLSFLLFSLSFAGGCAAGDDDDSSTPDDDSPAADDDFSPVDDDSSPGDDDDDNNDNDDDDNDNNNDNDNNDDDDNNNDNDNDDDLVGVDYLTMDGGPAIIGGAAYDPTGEIQVAALKNDSLNIYHFHDETVSVEPVAAGLNPRALTIDPFGNRHLIYCDYGNNVCGYATDASGNWSLSRVCRGCEAHHLLSDADGGLHHLYSGTNLYYAFNQGDGDWDARVILEGEVTGADMVVSPEGVAHILATRNLEYLTQLLYFEITDGQVSSRIMGTLPYWGGLFVGCEYEFPSIDLDSDGEPRIVYQIYEDDIFMYNIYLFQGWRENSVWQRAAIDEVCYSGEMIVAPDGTLTLLAVDRSGGGQDDYYLCAATDASGAWSDQIIDSDAGLGVVLFAAGEQVAVAYTGDQTMNLKLARREGNQWQYQALDPAVAAGRQPIMLAADSGEQAAVHLSFSENSIKYTWAEEGSYRSETIGAESLDYFDTRERLDAADESAGTLHVCLSDGNLRYLWGTPNDWHDELIEKFYSENCRIALDQNDRLHLTYTRNDPDYTANSTVRHGLRDGDSWVFTDLFDPSQGSGEGLAMEIDAANRLHLIYQRMGEDGCFIEHATGEEDVWTYENIYNQAPVELSGNIGMAIDGAGDLHATMCFRIRDADSVYHEDLIYATNASGTWQTTEIASGIYPAEYPSYQPFYDSDLTVVADGTVYLAYDYYPNGVHILKLATNPAGVWQKFTLDESAADVEMSPSIKLDRDGRVWVAYHDDHALRLVGLPFAPSSGK